LDNPGSLFDVCIVHMSEDGGVADSLRPLLDDPRVHYLRTAARGSSRAHNQAIARVAGDLLASTDDDCEVSNDWIEEMIHAFDRDPRIGVVFGNVLPADHHQRIGTAPAYIRRDDFMARDLREKAQVEGIWACMGLRREAWSALGGFDERFGRGASFPGGADSDLAIRALASGYYVFETPRVSVTHHRLLPPDQQRKAVEGYSYASGALLAKHLKRRTPNMFELLAVLALRWVHGRSHTSMSLGSDSHRVRRVVAVLRGAMRGLATPIDPESGQYMPVERGDID
jgi:GT2 family glycosyltransferase